MKKKLLILIGSLWILLICVVKTYLVDKKKYFKKVTKKM